MDYLERLLWMYRRAKAADDRVALINLTNRIRLEADRLGLAIEM